MSDENYVLFCDFFSITNLILAFMGCLGNVTAIKVFVSMGLKDGVTLSFLFLTTTDLLYLITMAIHSVALQLFVIEKKTSHGTWFWIEPFGIYIFFANIGNLIYFVTIMITTLLAVVRCLCVATPFRFKHMFNRKTSFMTCIVFCVLATSSYLPVLVYMSLAQAFDPKVNATRVLLWISPKREFVKQVVWISRDVSATFATEAIVIACIIIMARSIRATIQFRQASTLNGLNNFEDTNAKRYSSNGSGNVNNDQKSNFKSSGRGSSQRSNSVKLSHKEMSIVQQIILISLVYILSNMPKIIYMIF
ncbi:unnamed protein product [Lymnaea stagnalis]|uniref:G-protein coupled receptors family 1 profile domain-containing protein n=1 Tax=Lymnaea stagnalis TaxID=6523 RepID=A0AAV2HFD0_LYMST